MINGYDRMKNWLWIIGLFFVLSLHAEDGHRLWLRMERNAVPADVRLVEGTRRTDILDIASRELKTFGKGKDVCFFVYLKVGLRGMVLRFVRRTGHGTFFGIRPRRALCSL